MFLQNESLITDKTGTPKKKIVVVKKVVKVVKKIPAAAASDPTISAAVA
jgi:hypothetical protein